MNLKSLLFLFFFLFAGITAYSQELYFCEDVDSDGYPISESSTFTVGKNGGYLKVLVRLPYEVDCGEVSYIIYRVKNGKEVYETTISQSVDSDYVWFWKEITFYDAAKYNIYVYTEDDEFLCSGSLTIKKK